MPKLLTRQTRIQFNCYKGISCFNACCRNADVTLAPYNLDMFRRFVLSEKFRTTYTLNTAFYEAVETDDLILLDFAFQFLRQVLFGERSIEEASDAWEKRVEQRKEVWDMRARLEIERKQKAEDEKYKNHV